MRPLRWPMVALGAVLVAAAAGCGDDEPKGLAGLVRDPPLEVADLHLPEVGSHDGEELTMTAPKGELILVYFGYTSCPDICPTTMSDLSVAIGDLPAELTDRVTVAMTTVDPERDTAEILTGYLDHFFADSLAFRTDDPTELAAATDAFGVQFEVADHTATDTTYDVSHTAMTYVVDDTGTVVVEWPFGFATESMTSDITQLLREEPPT